VLRSAGNLNNAIGVPMTLLCLDERIEIAVLELGTSARGEIARLAEIARPDVGVVTAISSAHGAGIGDLEAIADEKMSLLTSLPVRGTAVFLADEPLMRDRLSKVTARHQLGFGRSERADVRLREQILTREPAMRCTLELRGQGPLELTLGLFGDGPALDAAAAVAVGLAVVGADALDGFARGLGRIPPPDGRLFPKTGPAGSLLLDDSYNANPASMRASIRATLELAQVRGGRALLVLGDMLELGDSSSDAHAAVGKLASDSHVLLLVAVGKEMARAARSFEGDAGMPEVRVVDDALAAVELIAERAKPADVILVKGSRGMALERVVSRLEQAAADKERGER
jgi:UDP-N-acetylmuramoyl-tripeptide--D-alanyl-D-alanine ligase